MNSTSQVQSNFSMADIEDDVDKVEIIARGGQTFVIEYKDDNVATPKWKCFRCAYECNSNTELETHFSNVHLGIASPTLPKEVSGNISRGSATVSNDIKCNFCSLQFPTGDILLQHLKTHNVIPHFVCMICKKRFDHEAVYVAHVIASKHFVLLVRKCPYCRAKYQDTDALDVHIKEKHGNITVQKCPFCQELFEDIHAIAKHVEKKHGIVKSIEKVTQLPKQYTAKNPEIVKSNMTKPNSINTRSKPSSSTAEPMIPLNEPATVFPKNMKNAAETIKTIAPKTQPDAGNSESVVSDKAIYHCCDEKFLGTQEYGNHKRTNHSTFSCPFCNTKCVGHPTLLEHIKTFHLTCDKCKKLMPTQDALIAHSKTHEFDELDDLEAHLDLKANVILKPTTDRDNFVDALAKWFVEDDKVSDDATNVEFINVQRNEKSILNYQNSSFGKPIRKRDIRKELPNVIESMKLTEQNAKQAKHEPTIVIVDSPPHRQPSPPTLQTYSRGQTKFTKITNTEPVRISSPHKLFEKIEDPIKQSEKSLRNQCELCFKPFFSEIQRRNHLMLEHGLEIKSKTQNQQQYPFKCLFCRSRFKHQNNLAVHQNLQHEKEMKQMSRIFQKQPKSTKLICEFCSQEISDETAMEEHKWRDHMIPKKRKIR